MQTIYVTDDGKHFFSTEKMCKDYETKHGEERKTIEAEIKELKKQRDDARKKLADIETKITEKTKLIEDDDDTISDIISLLWSL